VKRVNELLDLVEDPVSLETPVGDGESSYGDLIEDLKTERPDKQTSDRLRKHELAAALDRLNPRMRHVLALRFGLGEDGDPKTLEEVGEGLGLTRERADPKPREDVGEGLDITRERARQLESRALRELRVVAPDLELYLSAE